MEIGVGGTLSNADEKIPNKDDEECARLRLASDRYDWLRFPPRSARLDPEPFFRDVKRMGDSDFGAALVDESSDNFVKLFGYDGFGRAV